jgi:hypothetical protein
LNTRRRDALTNALKENRPQCNGIDAPGFDIDIRRIRPMCERAHEQAIVAGLKTVEYESAEGVC